MERACGVCTVTHALAYSRAVEQLTVTEVPPRARLGRVLLAELERLYNHVGDLGNICAGVGFHSGTSRLGWQKERLQRINEGLVGHRYLMGAVAPGGLRFDLPADALAGLPAELEAVSREVRAIVRSLVRSEGLMARLHGTGVVSRETAERLGAVGVAARASGLPFDLRRDRPYEAYAELEVPLVIGTTGDVAERFHVRAQELVASFALVREVARRLVAGPHRVPLATVPAAGASTIVGVEGPRGPSWLWLMAGPDGRSSGSAFAPRRSPTGRSSRQPFPATSCPTSRSSTRASSSATPARTAEVPLDVLARILDPLRRPVLSSGYPAAPPLLAQGIRGLPEVDPARCERDARCVAVCPTGDPSPSARTGWAIDAGRCVFCARLRDGLSDRRDQPRVARGAGGPGAGRPVDRDPAGETPMNVVRRRSDAPRAPAWPRR